MTPDTRDPAPIKLYEGCFGITRGGDGVPQMVRGPVYKPTDFEALFAWETDESLYEDDGRWMDDGEERVHDIIAVFPDRASAEVALAPAKPVQPGAPKRLRVTVAQNGVSINLVPAHFFSATYVLDEPGAPEGEALAESIAELRRQTPEAAPWSYHDFIGSHPEICGHLPRILNAVLSGALIPRPAEPARHDPMHGLRNAAGQNQEIDTALAAYSRGGALHRSFPEASDGRQMPPMGYDLMAAGLSGEDARFAAIQLAQNGLALVPAEPAQAAQVEWEALKVMLHNLEVEVQHMPHAVDHLSKERKLDRKSVLAAVGRCQRALIAAAQEGRT